MAKRAPKPKPEKSFSGCYLYPIGSPQTKDIREFITPDEIAANFSANKSYVKIFKGTKFYPSLIVSEFISNDSGMNSAIEIGSGAKMVSAVTELLCKIYNKLNERRI